MKILRKRNIKEMDLRSKMDLSSYVRNMESFDKMLECFVLQQNKLVLFNEIKFRKIRYGFDPSEFKSKLKKDEAVRII